MIEREEGSDREKELRLGYLEAFLAVAHHLDYGLAGKEVGIAPSNVQKCIVKLERWAGKSLIDSGKLPVLHEPDGSEFILLAIDVLKEFTTALGKLTFSNRAISLGGRASLRLSDLERIIYVANYKTYKVIEETDTGSETENKNKNRETNIKRKITSAEKILGIKLFAGHRKLSVSPEVSCFVRSMENIVRRLRGFQKSRHDLVLDILSMLKRERIIMRAAVLTWERRKRLSPLARRDMNEIKSKLEEIDRLIAGIHDDLDALEDRPTVPAKRAS